MNIFMANLYIYDKNKNLEVIDEQQILTTILLILRSFMLNMEVCKMNNQDQQKKIQKI